MSFSIYTNQNGDIQIPNLTISTNLEFPVGNVRIGNLAGNNNQASTAIAIGNDAGRQNQGISAVAVGVEAGETAQGQDGVAVGFQAGRDNQSNNAVAVGKEAGELGQGLSAVAVGHSAGSSTQSDYGVAVGWQAGLSGQGEGAVSVGKQAGQNSQGDNAVSVGIGAGFSNQKLNSVAVGNSAGQTDQGAVIGQCVAVGYQAGFNLQNDGAVAVGSKAGSTGQKSFSVAVGYEAGQTTQGQNCVAVGHLAGQTSQADRTIILNATGVALDGVGGQEDSSYMAPIRQKPALSSVGEFLNYDNTNKEIIRSDGLITWISGATIQDNFTGITFGVGMTVSDGDRKYIRIGKYIKGQYRVSWGVAGSASFSSPCLKLPTIVDMTAGNRIIGTFTLLTSGGLGLYNGFLVVNNADKTVAQLRIVRYSTSIPPPPYTDLLFLTNTTPDASIQSDGVLEFSFEYISSN